ncbi:MAG TPA: type II toxin-antitoxin system HipA family toxin [Solirubrobacterales bacterium]|jgi:serine/threonine-protein kinase HipA|nr:type II toxin-antitoxin system HipA family toxin [Solirubrobacterales bacterium]
MTELDVYLAGVKAGRLIRKDNGNMQFRYEPAYRGAPLSWALPVQTEAHPHALCRAVFGGLLPEGASREAIARRLGISAENDYSLLEDIGGDCAGAISVLPAGYTQNGVPLVEEISKDDLDEMVARLPQRPLAASPDGKTRLSLAGAQPKLPVILQGGKAFLPLNAAAPTTHIIKPEPIGFEGLVDNEAFCLELAARCGLTTASAEKSRTTTGLPYLLVERYDRDPTVEPIRRLHQEDFCQALGQPSDRKYQAEGGPSVRDSITLIRDAAALPAHDVPRFWEALVFNWLIGNCDAHAKNFSLLYDGGAPTLAPLYDLVATNLYEDLTQRLAMSIGTARMLDEVDQGSWVDLAKSVGLSERYARESTAAVAERVHTTVEAMDEDDGAYDDHIHGLCLSILKRSSELFQP